MYGALSKIEKLYEKGDWVVIMGAGGGLGHLYAFRARCFGQSVNDEQGPSNRQGNGIQHDRSRQVCPFPFLSYGTNVSTSPSKKDICLASGASAYFDFKDDNVHPPPPSSLHIC